MNAMEAKNFSKEEISRYNTAIKTGKKYEEEGNFTGAIEAYEKALVIYPTNVKIASRISKLMNTLRNENQPPLPSVGSTKTNDKSVKLSTIINTLQPSSITNSNNNSLRPSTETEEDDDIVVNSKKSSTIKITSSTTKMVEEANDESQRSAVSVSISSRNGNIHQGSENITASNIPSSSSPLPVSCPPSTRVSPSSPDDTGYSLAELRNILRRKSEKMEKSLPLSNTAVTMNNDTDNIPIEYETDIPVPSESSVTITSPSHTTNSFTAPTATTASSVPSVIDRYSISTNNKWATLPGNYKLPYKLFSQLYSYQRQGVAWMWSLHADCPLSSGSVGRESEFSSSSAFSSSPSENNPVNDPTVPYTAKLSMIDEYRPKKLSGGILADDMGLGKTVQVVSFVSGLFHSEKAETALIVLPVSLISVWEKEFQRFAPAVRVFTIHEIPDIKRRERIVRECIKEGGVILTTYGTVTSRPHVFGAEVQFTRSIPHDSTVPEENEENEETIDGNSEDDNYENDDAEDTHEHTDEDTISLDQLKGKTKKSTTTKPTKASNPKRKAQPKTSKTSHKSTTVAHAVATVVPIPIVWDIMVLDEGHKIKNPSTLAAKALRAIPSRYRLLLSGTPIQNNMDELWSLFDFTHCGKLLDTRRRFNSMIGDRIVKARDKKATAAERRDGALAMKELITIISPYMLRREKEKLLRKVETTTESTMNNGTESEAISSKNTITSSIDSLTESMGLLGLSTNNRPQTGLANTAMGKMGIKKEIILWTNLSSQQLTLYKQGLATGVIDDILEGKKESFILAAIANLKKIACHPKLLKSQFLQYKKSLDRSDHPSNEDDRTTDSSAPHSSLIDTSLTIDDTEDETNNSMLDNSFSLPPSATPNDTDSPNDNEWWDPSYLPNPSILIQESEKLRLLVLLLRLMAKEGQKVLVFSQSTRMLDILQLVTRQLYTVQIPNMPDIHTWDNNKPCEEFCTKVGGGTKERPCGLRSRRIDGTMKQTERAEAVDRFNNDPSVAVCFLTTGVGSLGLTLTAATCVIIYDVSWNPAIDAQAVDRAYRVGQTRDVMTFRLISAGTVEEKMYRLQVFKNGLTTTVMNSHGSNGNNQQSAVRLMTKDDLKDLFELGPTTYSQTQSLVDEVLTDVSNAPIPSQVINKHLQSLACPPLSEACVGVSHHDNLFKLAPENIKALVRAAALEAKGITYKRNKTGTNNESTNSNVAAQGNGMNDTDFLTAETNGISIAMPLVHPNNEKVIITTKTEDRTVNGVRSTTNNNPSNRPRNIIMDSDDEEEETKKMGTISVNTIEYVSNDTDNGLPTVSTGTLTRRSSNDETDDEEGSETLENILKKKNIYVKDDAEGKEAIHIMPSNSSEIDSTDENASVAYPNDESSDEYSSEVANIVTDTTTTILTNDDDEISNIPSDDIEILSPEAVFHAENVFGTVSPRLSLSHRNSIRGSIRSNKNRTSIGLKYNIDDYEDNNNTTPIDTNENILDNLPGIDFSDNSKGDSSNDTVNESFELLHKDFTMTNCTVPESLTYRNQNPTTELYTLIPLLDSSTSYADGEGITTGSTDGSTIGDDPLVQLRFLHAGFRLGYLKQNN